MELPKTLRVSVTQADITRGRCKDPGWCAVAQALRSAYPGLFVSVGNGDIVLGNKTYILPAAAHLWIRDFDASLVVFPFSFEARAAQ